MRAHRHILVPYNYPWPNGLLMMRRADDFYRDLRATRAWFAGRESGWTPAERVRRAAANAGEVWAE